MFAAIANGGVIDRFVPVDFTTSACTSNLVSSRMNTSFDSMPKGAVKEWIASNDWTAGTPASTITTRQINRATTQLHQNQSRQNRATAQNSPCRFHHSPRKSWIQKTDSLGFSHRRVLSERITATIRKSSQLSQTYPKDPIASKCSVKC